MSERRFPGLPHREAVRRKVPAVRFLLDDLIDVGTVGTIAGLPESYKSFLAVELAYKVAAGGALLGRDVVRTGAVGFWWQDDSEAAELSRLQAYAKRHGLSDDLPLRWHLNESPRLPEDLPSLRAEIEREQQVLVVLDSLYDFLDPKVALKDEDVGRELARLKSEVSDQTGCTICVVDHSPWPSESNRGQRRPYGSVFKAAAIRWGIYLERNGSKQLRVEARGNNFAGLASQPAQFDADALEVKIAASDEERRAIVQATLETSVAEHLAAHPTASANAVHKAIGGNRKAVLAAFRAVKTASDSAPRPADENGGSNRFSGTENRLEPGTSRTGSRVVPDPSLIGGREPPPSGASEDRSS